jgi:hypothetical protein
VTLDPAGRELLAAIGAALDVEPKPRTQAEVGPWMNRLRDRAAVIRRVCETVLASETRQADRARRYAAELRQLITDQDRRAADRQRREVRDAGGPRPGPAGGVDG